MLGEIIAQGSDEVASFLNETDGQEGLDEEEGYVHDGFDPLMPVQEEDYVHDGSGDTMEVQEGDRADCSGHRTESGQPSGSSTTSVRRRGPKKKLSSDEKFEIIEIAPDGEPIEPIRTRKAFSAQCGVLVRAKIPISIQQWYKPAKDEDPEVSYVNDMQKEDLWTELNANFTLPPEEDPEKPVKKQLIKSCALKKMASLMRMWRKELNQFVEKKKTPEFIGKYEKIKDHWPTFVAHKTSKKSKKMSATNKKNAAKKKLNHRMGSGGYLKARPKWSKAEHDLLEKGIEPETMRWPDCCWTWFFGAGGTLDPVTGKCQWTNEQLQTPVKNLRHYIDAAQRGTFLPNRDKDELTMAHGNPEHPGRTRGTPGSIPWKVGFPDAGGYKTHERRKKLEQDQMQALHERVMGLEEREEVREAADRNKRPAKASPKATPPSQQRSSVASTELLQPEHVLTAPASYPVDGITESQNYHIMARWMNLKVKAAVG
nr:transposon protein, putative, CACTA, En/Spm sub-class [Triticum aestivum]